jgi:thiamine pyrophosphokinase
VPARHRIALVFAGADVDPTPRLRARLAELEHPYVVAADNGAASALAFGYAPSVLLGDFDSIDPALFTELEGGGTRIERHPRDKEATDGQLAVDYVLQHVKPERMVLVGYLGGPRLDQALANVLLLATISTPALLLDADNEALLLRAGERFSWNPEPNELVSLLPLAGDAHGIRTQGLRFALDGESLRFGHTRGISNEPNADRASVSVERGTLLLTRHFPQAQAL